MGAAIIWTSHPVEAGCVCYTVDKVGSFTVGWDADAYPQRSETDRLIVRFGEATGAESGHELYRRDHVWPGAPTIHQITVTGIIYLDLAKVLTHLADPDPSPWRWWLGADRIRHGHAAPVTQAVNNRLVDILVQLAEDYLYRDDAALLWHAHERHHAHARLLRHRENLGLVERELREWQQRADHERALLGRCLDVLGDDLDMPVAGAAPCPGEASQRAGVPVPKFRDYSSAATHAGERFLLNTVGSRR